VPLDIASSPKEDTQFADAHLLDQPMLTPEGCDLACPSHLDDELGRERKCPARRYRTSWCSAERLL